jgi:hypothetical protein
MADPSGSRGIVALPLALALSFGASATDLPDPLHTPGAVDTAVTQDNIDHTICVPGYTKTVRPPAAYTNRVKREQLDTYYRGQGNMRDVELDHLIPLNTGGHPTAIENLWPQAYGGRYDASYKDSCEVATGIAICQRRVGLVEAQQGFATNWIEWCQKLMGEKR